jgi:hypothetical protein
MKTRGLAKVREGQQGDRKKEKEKKEKAGEQNRVCFWVQPLVGEDG